MARPPPNTSCWWNEAPLMAFQQLRDAECNVATPFHGGDAWLGYQGDFITVDLGHDGCQPWPAALSMTSAIAVVGMPTDFTSDASGAAVQPAVDSQDWTNLITVHDFKPGFQSLGCNWVDHCGDLIHKFPILPAASTVKAPEVKVPMDKSLAYNVSVDITSDNLFPLDIENWFQQNSRACCLKISAVLFIDNGTQPLPQWLSLYYNLTRAASGPQLTAGYSLKVYAQPGVAAVGQHTIRILASDESMPDLPAAFVNLQLLVIGKGPTIIGQFPAVEVADGQLLEYAIPINVIQLNKPYGQLSYSAEQQAGMRLPTWLGLTEDGILRGTPSLGIDTAFNLSIAGSDSDGAQNNTFLMLWIDRCGILSQTFPIQLASASVGPPEALQAFASQRAFSVPVDISDDKFLPLDTDSWFKRNGRVCCLGISAGVMTDNRTQPLQPLPPFLSIWYNLTRSASGPQLTADHALKVSAQPGRGALGNYTVRILATDESLPNSVPAFVDLKLLILGGAPTIVGEFQAVEVAVGQYLIYALPTNVIQLNKPYGKLSYSAKQQGGMPLPTWLSLNDVGLLQGTPDLGADTSYNLSITATDIDGAQNTTSLMVHVRRACPSGLYRHFRLRVSEDNQPGWYDQIGFSGGRSAICSVAWDTLQPSSSSFPSLTGNVSGNVSGTTYRANHPWTGTRDAAPITAFQQLKDAGCDVANPFNGGNAWLGYPGDFVAVDVGFAGCRPWPTAMQVTSPIAVIGMPTDMTSEASGSALQPASDSADWIHLVIIRQFKPVLPRSFGCSSVWWNRCGVLKNNFPIASQGQPFSSLAKATGAIPDVLIEVGIPNDVLLDITGLFKSTDGFCCPIIRLSIISFVAAADGLTTDAGQGSAVSPYVPAGYLLPSSFSSMTLSSPSSAIVPFEPLLQPSMLQTYGSYGSYGYGSYSHGSVAAPAPAPAPSPPASISQPGPLVNLTSQLPVPTWLSTQFELNYSNPNSQQLNTWQYIRISRTVPVTAIGSYVVEVISQSPVSSDASAVFFNLDVVDFYQLRVLLALGGVPTAGLSTAQQAAFQIGVSAAFNLSTSQVSLGTPTGQRRMLLQSSGYVLNFSITGLNGRKQALALATSLEQSVKDGQLSQSLGSSGLSTQVALAASPQVVKAAADAAQQPSTSDLSGQDTSPAASGSQPPDQAPAPPTFIEPARPQAGSAPQTPAPLPSSSSADPVAPAVSLPPEQGMNPPPPPEQPLTAIQGPSPNLDRQANMGPTPLQDMVNSSPAGTMEPAASPPQLLGLHDASAPGREDLWPGNALDHAPASQVWPARAPLYSLPAAAGNRSFGPSQSPFSSEPRPSTRTALPPLPPPPPPPDIGFLNTRPLPPNAAPAVTSESVPVVSIPFAVPDLTIASFTDEIKQALLDAITASIPATSNVRVYITNIREGSLLFDTVVLFLDGDSGAAQILTDTAAASTTAANATTAAPGPSGTSPVRSGGFILPPALARATVPTVPIILQTANPNAIHQPPTSPPPSPPSATSGTPDLQQQVAPVMAPADGPKPSSSYLASPQPSQETVHSGPANAPSPDPSGPPTRTDPPTHFSPTPSAINPSMTSPPTNQSSPPPASSPPPPASPVSTISTSNVASPSTAAEIPLVTFAASLTSFTIATFTAALQSDFKQALISKLPANSAVTVELLNIRDGSLLLNAALTFLNGDVAGANTLTSLLSTSNGIQSIFDPNGPFGAIDITNVKQGTTANPHAASKQLNPGKIAGIAIGCAAAAVLLISIVTAVVVMRCRKQRVHEHVALDSGPPADPSAQPQASSSPTAFHRGHQSQPAP
ncbi:hypothetical protein WJX74_007372 [Apatococcus lobatus]|uniref:Dystroglycan-type cadherin-like domain-containing protein n=1 Tax=Apatococcus lobatus TaxID=904363 RepID=A0AAW1QMV9_9CHLO